MNYINIHTWKVTKILEWDRNWNFTLPGFEKKLEYHKKWIYMLPGFELKFLELDNNRTYVLIGFERNFRNGQELDI